ncbi:MAG TPA: NUDIX hydrolase [Polyangiaceae bacterium]|nr:NUDIX hydrolase [Polyangiaceae bacterium]
MRRTPPRRGLELPTIRLELVEDVSPHDAGGFLKLIRQRYRAHYPDGSSSQPFLYDSVDRRAIDAVVICAHYTTAGGPCVYLRSCLRPPLFTRSKTRGPYDVPEPLGALWELPAGLVEERDQNPEGPALTAQRELFEELGFQVPIEAVQPLGFPLLAAPGFVAEQQFFFHVEVDPATQKQPELDGSPLEHCGQVIALPLGEALEMCRKGSFHDAKTELGLRRLAEELA